MDVNLPQEKDFDPADGDLDAQCAWKNFGGLNLEEADKRFIENPLYYQEDFMFMGWVAFEYYFPVIEKYLIETHLVAENDDSETWILGCVIESQIRANKEKIAVTFLKNLKNLCHSIIQKYTNSMLPKDEKDEVLTQWKKIEQHLKQI